MNFNYLYLMLIVIVLLNISASVYLAKRDDLEVFQKCAQITLVWLFPVVAAIALIIFHHSQDMPVSASRQFGGGHSDGSGAGSDGSGL
ncbi:hypothetical protein EYS14_23145 [Alteromonadaceae bacterium M269]|nr:hypothetical protein EYS14_23145 [Alteromonadaceae bacterium M269]